MLVAGYAQNSEAGIMLSENNVQGEYSLVNDVSQPGYNIMGTIRWWNDSDPVPANNQISANGTFGTNQGLYKIDTDDDTHDRNPPTYDIDKPESFNIQYADGVVNTPNDSDTFKFYFNLGPSVTSESQAQTIVDNLNAMISGQTTFTQDQPFLYKRDINGLVNGDGVFHDEFENSPSVYVIPEPVTITSLLVGMGALLGIKKFKEKKL